MPKISLFYHKDKEKLKKLIYKLIITNIYLFIPFLTFGLLYGKEIIIIIYGNEYVGGLLAFNLFLITRFIGTFTISYGSTLQICNHEKFFMKGVLIGGIMNIILNIILIPIFNLNGAVISTLLSEILVFIIMYYKFNKSIVKLSIFNYIYKLNPYINEENILLLEGKILGSPIVLFNCEYIKEKGLWKLLNFKIEYETVK